MSEKLTPEEWCDRTGIRIMDPDGWNRKVFEVDWNIPLTRDEFLGKAFLSTCHKWPHPLLDEEQVKWEFPHFVPEVVVSAPDKVQEEPDNLVSLFKGLDVDGRINSPAVLDFVEGATMMFSMYSAYVAAGFTEAQAMQLLTASLTGKPQ